jgi:hypothetical protein
LLRKLEKGTFSQRLQHRSSSIWRRPRIMAPLAT